MITTISEAFARRFADAFDLIVREPPVADTELRVTLVWSHIHATFLCGLVPRAGSGCCSAGVPKQWQARHLVDLD